MRKISPLIQLLLLLGISVLFVVVLNGKGLSSRSSTQGSAQKEEDKNETPHEGVRARLAVDSFAKEIQERSDERLYRPYHDLKVFNKEKSSPGVTLVGVNEAGEVILLSHDGKILNSWAIDSDRSILLPKKCTLLATHGTVMGAKISPWKVLRQTLREYSPSGELLWEYKGPDLLHHDVRRISDDKFLALRQRLVPYRGNQPIGEGFEMKADGLIIVNRSGEIEYSWNSEEHIDNDFCGIRGCPSAEGMKMSRAELKRRKDWTHVNTVSVLPENHWFDEGDERFRPGNFFVHVRNFWMSLIVDRETKEVVWRFPTYQEFNDDPKKEIRGGHESHMIPPGRPGAGNVLIFDNGSSEVRPYSRVLEIDPVNREVVWIYEDQKHFFSRTAGAVQRLPNGNTLISEDLKGRVFEVTTEGEIVWEMDTPYRTARARRYPTDYCS